MNPQFQLMLQQAIQNFQNGNFESAAITLKRILQVDAKNLPALHILGLIQASQGRFKESSELLGRAVRLSPNDASIQYNLAKALMDCGSIKESIPHHKKAVELVSNNPDAWLNYGKAVSDLGRYEEAIAHYDQALNLKPDFVLALLNKGATLMRLKRYEESIAFADQALILNPNLAEAWSNKGGVLNDLKRYEEAIVNCEKAIALKPDYCEAWSNKAVALDYLGQHDHSAACFLKALELKTGDSYFLGQAHHQMMLTCDWSDYQEMTNQIFSLIDQGKKGAEPFGFQGIALSEALLKKCAEMYSNDLFPSLGNLVSNSKYEHKKIRVGYLCGEFRQQATSVLMARIWELHDQSQFEIFAFDNGWDDHSEYRQRIEGAFSKVFDISRMSDFDAAKLIHSNEIDILVNLNGFFGLARQGIFSYRPAPIQVNYLGFPGTIGAPYIDYIIADKVVLPEASKEYYTEKVAYLPGTYQANDNHRKISDKSFTKAELGLPEDGFVFACFNNTYKITPANFDLWARILGRVDNSVLWILAEDLAAKENLVKEAVARNIDPDRLIFAERFDLSEHLSRQSMADLFLDTYPYNAHTTCSDALWSGLPVLTLAGNTFPARVSSSLLNAIGLTELIANTEQEYENLAVEMALNPEKIKAAKEKLAANRLTTPLFDSESFCKHLELAYAEMVRRQLAGLSPDHIIVP